MGGERRGEEMMTMMYATNDRQYTRLFETVSKPSFEKTSPSKMDQILVD
jgi:hypothetical protein